MKGIFITGTGTGVGKTHVTGLLLRALRAHGVNALSIKPVQTGCLPGQTAPDLLEHWRLADWKPEPGLAARCAPFCFREPASPHLAAAMEGRLITCAEIDKKLQTSIENNAFCLVEGAGGILVPLNQAETMLDLMKCLDLSVLVVAAAGLGTINHSLLTLEALNRAGLTILGTVLSVLDTDPKHLVASNAETIAAFGKLPVYRTDNLDQLVQALLPHTFAE